MDSSTALPDTKQTELERQGFTILRDVFGEDDLDDKISLIDDIIETHRDGFVDPFVPETEFMEHRTDQGALYDVVNRHPPFLEMAKKPRILDALEPILGSHLFLYVSSIVYKPEGARNEVPLHQDFLSRSGESTRVIAWTPLSDVDRTNGCLKAIPGSHLDGFRDWHRVEGETHHSRLNEDQYDENEVEYLEMEAGDVLLFHNQLVHGSDRVEKQNNRYALRVVYKGVSSDDVEVPRSGPPMLRGGNPADMRSDCSLLDREDVDPSKPPRSFLRRGLRFIGEKMVELSEL